MPILPANLTLLRSEGHQHSVRISWLVPPVLWQAQINDLAIVKGQTDIDFDTGSGSYFSLVGPLQEVWVGTSAGDNDVGRLRVKSISSGDAGVTGTVNVGGHSHPLTDGLHLTFLHDYPLKPKASYIDPATEIWYMDDDVVYSNQHSNPPPVVVAGPHRADFLDPTSGEVVFNVDASDSYTIKSGATVSSYGLTVASTAASPTISFSSVTGLGDITFDTPGYYWARYTVTDSASTVQVSYRLYIIHDPDRQTGPVPWTYTDQIQIEGDWENGGYTAAVKGKDDFLLTEIPDHTLCIIWQDSIYAGTAGEITFMPDYNKAVFIGYVREDTAILDMNLGIGEVDLILSTVEGRLRQIFTFSTSLIVKNGTPSDWFEYEKWQTCGTIVHDLFLWRSTLLEISDVIGLRDDTLNRMFQGFDEGNIYDNANNFLYSEGIRKRVLCDQGGRVHIAPDMQLLLDADRAALPTLFDIVQTPVIADYGDSLVMTRRQEFAAPFITANGIFWDGNTWDAENRPESNGEYCSIAPGGKPLYDGPSPQDFPKQTVSSQANLNAIAGRFEAKVNNTIPELALRFHGSYNTVLDIAYTEACTISLQASQNPRGIVWSGKQVYIRHVQSIFDSRLGTWEVHASFEPENVTTDGVTTECPSFPPLGGIVPIIDIEIPPGDAPGALMTGASVHAKSATGDLWSELTSEAVEDLIADPFWRITQGTDAPSSAIVWRCGVGYVKRSTDGGASWSTVTPGTAPPNYASDAPAPTAGGVTYATMDASYGVSGEFVVLARWQNGSGDWRSWLAHTDDNGSTWTWTPLTITAIGDEVLSSGTTAEIVDNSPDGLSWTANTERHFCRMTETLGVAIANREDGSDQTVTAYLLSRSGDTITVEDSVDVHTAVSTINSNDYLNVVRLSDSRYMAIWHNDVDDRIEARTGDITLNTIANKSSVLSFASGAAVGEISAAVLDSNDVAVIWKDGTTLETAILTDIESAISKGSDYTVIAGVSDAASVCALTDTKFIVSYEDTTPNSGRSVVCTRSLSVVTVSGTDYQFQGSGLSAVNSIGLTSSRFVASWWDSPFQRYIVGDVSGTVISFGSIQNGPISGAGTVGLDRLSDSAIIVSGDEGSSPFNVTLTVGNISGTTITWGTDWTHGSLVEGYRSNVWLWSGLTVAYVYLNSGANTMNAFVGNLESSGSDISKGLSVGIGKATSLVIWATLWDGTDLKLIGFNIGDLSEYANVDLGECSESELNAKSFIAYCYPGWSSDDKVYVFGRMNDPQSLGLSHIIKTLDGGSAWSVVENGWSFDHAGSLQVDLDDIIYAVRNQAAKGTLYVDEADETLLVKLTVPFDEPVAPHGMLVDFYNADVYLTAWGADPIMVIKVVLPYSTYTDLTFDHDNTVSIESIIGL